MSLQKTDVFFGGADDEILRHESLDEYVEHHLDGQAPTLPEEVEVIEFRRKQLPADLEYAGRGLRPLEHALESLDEDYGNHVDGTGFEPTERMKEAEAAFLRVSGRLRVHGHPLPAPSANEYTVGMASGTPNDGHRQVPGRVSRGVRLSR